MAVKWNFPSNNFGTLNGIGEAGIETFKGAPYRSLAREICQNSLDARASQSKPVRVVFSLASWQRKEIPGYTELRDSISHCLEFWKEQGNKKTVDFFTDAESVFSAFSIDILRVSDYNTTGLTGSNKEYNSPWQDLVKASGVSSKGGSSGGSFGIGKSAPFACSRLRTVFYATKDINGLEAFQGIARLVSFREKGPYRDHDSITTGIGYYGETEKNSAIRECRSLETGYRRNEPGTDVYVLGFMPSHDWKREMVKAILEDFLLAIYLHNLEVTVADTQITAATLGKITEEYKEEAPTAYNYYLVLTSPDTNTVSGDFNGLGTVELRILIQNGLHRQVMMCRMNGMKIFDKKHITASIEFAGICLLKDERINSYFREMENPQHNAWEPERHSNPTEAKKDRIALFKYIKDTVIDYGHNITVDEEDAEGVGQFLPDMPETDMQKQGAAENLTDATKDIDIQVAGPETWQKGFERSTSGEALDYDLLPGEADEMDTGGEGGKDYAEDDENASGNGTGFGAEDGNGPGIHGEGENPFFDGMDSETGTGKVMKKKQVQIMAVRLFRIDPKRNGYRLSFVPKQTYNKGFLQIRLSGEQKSSDDLSVPMAWMPVTGEVLKSKGNRIWLNNIAGSQKTTVDFYILNSEACSMEVGLYGYTV